MKRNTSSKGKGSRRLPSNAAEEREARLELALRPPQLIDQLSLGFTFRWVGNSRAPQAMSVTYQNLLDSWLIAGSATNGYQLFDFIKIKRVTLRAISTASDTFGATITLAIDFPGLNTGQLGSGKQRTQTFLGTAEPAMVSLKPDPKSQAAQFQPTSTSTAFIVRAFNQGQAAFQGVIVDLDCVLKNSGEINPAAIQHPIAGATPGNLYFGALDGNRTASAMYDSVFIPNI